MAFPTSPVDGHRYLDYTYSSTLDSWEKTPKGTVLNRFLEYDTTARNITSVQPTYTDGMIWTEMQCAGKSVLEILLKVNGRNDYTSSWGGIYTELQYRIDDGSGYGSYISFGTSGFDLSMVQDGSSIESRVYPIRFDTSSYAAPFKIQFKNRHAVYTDGSTARLNTSNASSSYFRSLIQVTEFAV